MSKMKFLKPGEERLIQEESLTLTENGVDGYQSTELSSFVSSNQYDSVENQRRNLPIYHTRDKFLYALETNRIIIVCGDTGCGKSTQIPQYVYESGWLSKNGGCGLMAVTQPRRIAAISLASRIADEKGWKMGRQIGYHIRFENVTSDRTSIKFFTDGMLIQIDSGFTRMRAYNSVNGLECLVTMKISQASADQRAGRAGRQRPGEVYRLYSEDDFHNFPLYTSPESMRIDLSCVLLRLKTLGIDNLADFDWLPPKPPLEHLGRSAERLVALGALEPSKGKLNLDKGNQLAEIISSCGFSDPGAATVLLGALEEGCTKQVASVLALIQMQQVFVTTQGHLKAGDLHKIQNFGCRQGDHLTMLNAFSAFELMANDPNQDKKSVQKWCEENNLNFKTLSHAQKFRESIFNVLKRLKIPLIDVEPPGNPDPILRSLLRGYFTNLAKLDSRTGSYKTVRGNHELKIHPGSVYYSSSDKLGLPQYIIFTRVLLGGTYEDRFLFNQEKSPSTFITEISAVQSEWIRELIHHYYSYGTDREQIENSLRNSSKQLF